MLISGIASDLSNDVTTTYPRVVVPIVEPSPGSNNIADVIVWDRHPSIPGFTPAIYEIARQLKERIPLEGAEIILPNGAIQIFRGDTFFSGFLSEPSDRLVVGARFAVVFRGNNYE